MFVYWIGVAVAISILDSDVNSFQYRALFFPIAPLLLVFLLGLQLLALALYLRLKLVFSYDPGLLNLMGSSFWPLVLMTLLVIPFFIIAALFTRD